MVTCFHNKTYFIKLLTDPLSACLRKELSRWVKDRETGAGMCMSCPDLRDPYYSLCLVRSGCDSGKESLCFLFLCFLLCVVPNQRQLSIVVSDWGSYISCNFPFGLCGVLFAV